MAFGKMGRGVRVLRVELSLLVSYDPYGYYHLHTYQAVEIESTRSKFSSCMALSKHGPSCSPCYYLQFECFFPSPCFSCFLLTFFSALLVFAARLVHRHETSTRFGCHTNREPHPYLHICSSCCKPSHTARKAEHKPKHLRKTREGQMI